MARLVAQRAHRSEFTYDGIGHRVRTEEKDNDVVESDARVVWCDQQVCEEQAVDGTIVRKSLQLR